MRICFMRQNKGNPRNDRRSPTIFDEMFMAMEIAGLADIRKELIHQSPDELVELVLRLARFRQDNKALAGYWLFDRQNPTEFLRQVHQALDHGFDELNFSTGYWVKKGLRKWQRQVNLYGRICGEAWMQADMQSYYVWVCLRAQKRLSDPNYLAPLLASAEKKRVTLVKKLDDDVQHDIQRQFERWIKS